ncbi:MAG: hypothetical protein LBM67_03200 [Lentimicrobiaceae bacterium]|jgi:hypothetical protein|nr:hypothetical protein [Lentimicrobiaceae bacterium]
MSELFLRDKSVISRHIRNVYTEQELTKQATVANFATVQNEIGASLKDLGKKLFAFSKMGMEINELLKNI